MSPPPLTVTDALAEQAELWLVAVLASSRYVTCEADAAPEALVVPPLVRTVALQLVVCRVAWVSSSACAAA